MRFKILQITKDADYLYSGYSVAKKHGFSLDDYSEIFQGEDEALTGLTPEEALEVLFRRFNRTTKASAVYLENIGFKGRSVSVSDIIVLDDEYYYVDLVGYSRLEIEPVQAAMKKQIRKTKLARFTIEDSKTSEPQMLITDQQTGKSVEVPIFAASTVMEVLKSLFC